MGNSVACHSYHSDVCKSIYFVRKSRMSS